MMLRAFQNVRPMGEKDNRACTRLSDEILLRVKARNAGKHSNRISTGFIAVMTVRREQKAVTM